MANETSKRPKTESTEPEESDEILDWMRENNLPLTRQEYLNVRFMGEVPKELSAEQELDMPVQFRQLDEE